MTRKYRHKGQCHCGNIHFTFETDNALAELPLRECDCSFCQKHAGRYTSDPGGALTVKFSNPENINRYHFGHKTADFIICKICGGFPLVTSEIDQNCYAVLNVNCLNDLTGITGMGKEVSYDAEAIENRLARRKKFWISSVSFS